MQDQPKREDHVPGRGECHIEVEVSGSLPRSFDAPATQNLARMLADAGIPLNTRCNHRGLCRGCAVFLEGVEILACEYEPSGGERLRVRIPPRSQLAHPPSIVSDFQCLVPSGCDPIFVDSGRPNGLAVDIGTTTVALMLVELRGGKVLSRVSAMNAQISRGDNVLTRIQLCQEDPTAVQLLMDDFWKGTFHPLLEKACGEAGVGVDSIAGGVFSGNTTMLHLACGEDPTPLGVVPFRPRFLDRREEPGERFGLPGGTRVVFLPGLSAYVGSDLVAGAICCGLAYAEQPRLLVDIGTNGEMLLLDSGGRITGCATAAGPAFEGSGLSCGMRAASGAVGKIVFEADPFGVRCELIGGEKAAPVGIAGSAYVDFLAGARRVGVLLESGRFDRDFIRLHPSFFQEADGGMAFVLPVGSPALRVSEVDVALLLQAKAAIAAGIGTLLEREGMRVGEIGRLFLAGGFGLHINIASAIACGLLPGFVPEQVQAVGNTALGGAYLALIDRALDEEMDGLRAQILELNLDPGFEDRYLDCLSLPDPQ